MRIPRTIPQGVTVIDGYPIPAGGAPKGGEGEGQGEGEGEGTGEGEGDGDGQDDGARGADDDGQSQSDDDGSSDDGDGDSGRAGGEEALRADLARERRRRQEAERRAKELETANESETEAREREIREQAQAPAIRALRSTAVEMAAAEAGFLYPSDVYSLLTAEERDSIDVDLEDETPTPDREAAAEIVKALAKRRPGLLRPADDGDGDDGKGAGGSDHQAGGNRRQSQGSSSDPNANLRNLLRQKLGTPSR